MSKLLILLAFLLPFSMNIAADLAFSNTLVKKEQYLKVQRTLHHLSIDGQNAMQDILEAQKALSLSNAKKASSFLSKATNTLNKADRQNIKFIKSLEELHPRNKKQALKKYKKTKTVAWLPVGGEFVITEEISTRNQATAKKINALIKAGRNQEVLALPQMVSDLDFIVALVPLSETQDQVLKALLATKANDTPRATKILNDIIDSVILVNDDVLLASH